MIRIKSVDKQPDRLRIPVSARNRMIRWLAGLPVQLVAARSVMAVLMLSASEGGGCITWRHEGLLLAVVLTWLGQLR